MDNQNDADNLYYRLMKQSTTIPTETAKILAGVNIFLAIAASLGNGVILMALPKVSSVHPPTKLLFQCLAVTDLCVGVIIQPLFIPLVLDSVLKINMKLFCFHLLRASRSKLYVVYSLFPHRNHHCCRQTSCSQVGIKIQTCRQLAAS